MARGGLWRAEAEFAVRAAPARRALRPRQRHGKYQIERRIAEGSFADVYRALDTVEGVRVALKIPQAHLVDDELLGAFRREVRLAAKLDHPNVLPLKQVRISATDSGGTARRLFRGVVQPRAGWTFEYDNPNGARVTITCTDLLGFLALRELPQLGRSWSTQLRATQPRI